MISLENVSQAILALQNMDMDADTLLQKTKEFFFLLFQEDSFFIIAADASISDDALQNKAVLHCHRKSSSYRFHRASDFQPQNL